MVELKDFKLVYGGTTLYFGSDSTEKIREHIAGKKRALIVTGRRSARESGALKDVESVLEDLKIERKIFDRVSFNPTVEIVEEIVEELKSFSPDFIVAIGGGSVIDSAKLASAAYAESRNPADYIKGRAKAQKHLFLVAVNLTHGTGTEIDRYAVATISQTKEKLGTIVAYPDVSVDNPKYLLTLSRNQTIFTSLDALYHALESSISSSSNALVIDLSRAAVEKIFSYLGKAVSNPRDIESRYMLLYSSMLAGIAIDLAGTSIIHGLEHGLSGVEPGLEHGAGLAIIGPTLMKVLYRVRTEEAYAVMRIIDPELRPLAEDAERAGESLARFQESVGFNLSLADYGFDEKKLREAIEVSWPLFNGRLIPGVLEMGKEQIFSLLRPLLK
ncbi:MAG: iron-containing alcohol dehydrogenase [Fervidicoccaceae archaeon]